MPSFSKVVRDPVAQAPDTVLTTGIQVAARQREVHLHIGEQAPSGTPTLFPGSGDYPEGTTNATLQALIDRKLERSAVTGMRDLVLWFENKLV